MGSSEMCHFVSKHLKNPRRFGCRAPSSLLSENILLQTENPLKLTEIHFVVLFVSPRSRGNRTQRRKIKPLRVKAATDHVGRGPPGRRGPGPREPGVWTCNCLSAARTAPTISPGSPPRQSSLGGAGDTYQQPASSDSAHLLSSKCLAPNRPNTRPCISSLHNYF